MNFMVTVVGINILFEIGSVSIFIVFSVSLQVIDQNMKIDFPEKTLQTMADRFQQALGASCATGEGNFTAALKSLGYQIVVASL